MRAPERILVRAPNWIGDQALAYPFFHALRAAYPKAHVTVACVPWVAEIQFRNLVDEVHVMARPATSQWREKLFVLESEAKALRSKGPWDLAFSLPNSISAAWLLFRARAKERVGYRTEGRGWLLTDRRDWDPKPEIHRAQSYVDLLPKAARPRWAARKFWGLPPASELDPAQPGVLEVFDDRLAWPGFDRLEPPSEDYWVLAPGATAVSRRWPPEAFLSLAKRIHRATGMRGLVVGGPKEAPLADELCSDREAGLSDWTAKGPVPGLTDVFRRSRFTVTNESGLAHIAALCGAYTQIVCGAADPRRTTPIGPGRVQVAFNPVDCWPCEANVCLNPPERQLACLKGITPETLWEEIQRGDRLERRSLYR